MGTLYDRIFHLCEERGITGYRLSADIGISKSLITDLKMGRKKTVNAETANRIADYFGVSVGYLLGLEQKEKVPVLTEKDKHDISDDDIKFALFGDKTIDDETYESVKNFAKFAAEQKRKRKEGEQ